MAVQARYRGELFAMAAQGGPQFRNLARALKDAGRGDLAKKLRKAIRTAGKPVVEDVRQAYRTLPDVSPARRPGVQAGEALAKAVTLQITQNGVRIAVVRSKLPDDMKPLPMAFERGKWRHPVFARSTQTRSQWRWVTQTMPPPFRATVRAHHEEFRTAVIGAMQEVAAEIDASI